MYKPHLYEHSEIHSAYKLPFSTNHGLQIISYILEPYSQLFHIFSLVQAYFYEVEELQ